MLATHTQELLRHRNRTLAKSFYRQLKSEGLTHEQLCAKIVSERAEQRLLRDPDELRRRRRRRRQDAVESE